MGFLSRDQVNQYHRDGYFIVRRYADDTSIEELRRSMARIVAECDPGDLPIFTTERNGESREAYFLESGDKIRCFFEEEAVDDQGNLLVEKERAINKVGHALHDLHLVFRRFSYRRELLDIAFSLGYERPSIVQSQYIFKQPRIGGRVNPHIDSTFLYTNPPSCLGAWVALEDATADNGCLSAIPGSHRTYPIQERFVANKARTATGFIETMEERVDWDTSQLRPLEVEAGDLILLHGALVHASNANRSGKSRHAYILHLVDLACHWAEDNWLRRPADFPFRAMEEVIVPES